MYKRQRLLLENRVPRETARQAPIIFPPWYSKLSATDVTAEAIFERLYLVPGLIPFEPRVS